MLLWTGAGGFRHQSTVLRIKGMFPVGVGSNAARNLIFRYTKSIWIIITVCVKIKTGREQADRGMDCGAGNGSTADTRGRTDEICGHNGEQVIFSVDSNHYPFRNN